MQKAQDFVTSQFPNHKALILKFWDGDEDFVELCEHYVWMTEVAKYNQDQERSERYAILRDKLFDELKVYIRKRK
jgi:hypothetical protein